MKISSNRHYFVAILAGLVSFQVIALLLVFLAELIPDTLIVDALIEGVDEKWITAEHIKTGLDNKVDRLTECTAFKLGLGDRKGSTRLETAISNPNLGSCDRVIASL